MTLSIENRVLEIDFDGVLSEKVISDLLARVDSLAGCSDKIKKDIKIVIIELGLNIISHGTEQSFGAIYLYRNRKEFFIETSNFTSVANLERVAEVLDKLKSIVDLKAHYFSLLELISSQRSVQLGLLKIYRICDRNMLCSGETIQGNLLLKLKITINDNY